jgi:hypothetical protein
VLDSIHHLRYIYYIQLFGSCLYSLLQWFIVMVTNIFDYFVIINIIDPGQGRNRNPLNVNPGGILITKRI